MIENAEWDYYYDSKFAKKLGVRVDIVRRLAESGTIRAKKIRRANGTHFYIIAKDDLKAMRENTWVQFND